MTTVPSQLKSRGTRRIESRWRRIETTIPAPQSVPLLKELQVLESRSMLGMPPVLWHEAEGFLVRDAYGNQWIDLTSGIVVANAGHSHPKIVEAIIRQAQSKLLFSYAFPNDPRRKLLAELVALSPIHDSKAVLFSAGTEATECAITLMRRHGRLRSPSKVGIIGFTQGYHGRTLGASLAGGAPSPNDWLERAALGNHLLPYPFGSNPKSFAACLSELTAKGVSPEQIAGVIVEPMQGWTASLLPQEFVLTMMAWAQEHDILVTFDEVQVGCGRTGRFFACEHLGTIPDLICLGKGLSSSLPVSSVLGRHDVLDLAEPGEMSSTHSGNPICAAAALANLKVLREERLVEHAAQVGHVLRNELEKLKQQFPTHVQSITGTGLIFAVHLKRTDDGKPDIELADAVANEAVRQGVLMFVTRRGYLKITPPLCIEPEAVIEAVEVICDAIASIVGNRRKIA